MTYPFEVLLGAAHPLPNKSKWVCSNTIIYQTTQRKSCASFAKWIESEVLFASSPLFSLGAICGLHQRENLIVENQPWKMSHEDQPEAKKWLAFCQSLFKQHQLSCLDRKDPAFVRQRRGRDEPFLKINFHHLESLLPLQSAFKSKASFLSLRKINGTVKMVFC